MSTKAMFPLVTAVALLAVVAASPASSLGMRASPVDESCADADQRVALVEGGAVDAHLAGWICASGSFDGQTVIVASPTGFSHHAYWDWPEDPSAYSFVHAATAAGYAVFNYDRVGTGASDRPAAALVTVESEAFVLHQLVERLRAGEIDGTRYGKVVLLGNSLSTFISIFEAETYADVDGLINTGIFVGPRAEGLAQLFGALYPAQADPKFADDDIPPGYATTMPGARAQFFHLPATETSTLVLDEQLKETATLGEAATFPHWIPGTRLVTVPVLSIMGDHDILFCDPRCEPGGAEATRERTWWAPETCLEVEIVPDAGHFIQLHRQGAADSNAIIGSWLERRIGNGPASTPSAPCADA